MISSISLTEGPLVLEALDLGAVDYIQKPKLEEVITIAPIIRERLKVAAEANVRAGKNSSRSSSAPKAKIYEKRETDLILIGASTGGTEAIRTVIEKWPNNLPPIAIVQHIPPVFSKAFADRLRQLCKIDVHEARGGEALLPGKAFVAAGGTQMKIVRRGEGLVTEVTDDPPVNRHKPAVDYMFDSVCNLKPFPNTLAIILTGMGQDGAKGLLNLKNKGAYTIAQNEESCVVFGMPKEAIKLGGAHRVLHLNDIADHVLQVVQLKKAGAQKVA
jgi:two-component system chemotaxis response regulator CheB